MFRSAVRVGPNMISAPGYSTRVEIKADDPDGMLWVVLKLRLYIDGTSPEFGSTDQVYAMFDASSNTWIADLGEDPGTNRSTRNWVVEEIELTDSEYNQSVFTDRNVLDSLGFGYENPLYDGQAPVLKSIEVKPKVALPDEEVRVTLRVSDASGSEEPEFNLVPFSSASEWDMPGSTTPMTSVNEGSGVTAYTKTYKGTAFTQYGQYKIDVVRLSDVHHNDAYVTAGAKITIDDPKHPVGTSKVAGTMVVGNTLEATPSWPGTSRVDFRWTRSGNWRFTFANGPKLPLTEYQPKGEFGLVSTGYWADGTIRSRHQILDMVQEGTLDLGKPALSGKNTDGSLLTLNHKFPALPAHPASSKVTYHYEWLRDGQYIMVPSQRTYRVTDSDIGHVMSVRFSASASGYRSEHRTTAGVKIIGTLRAPAPTISGAAGIGSKFTATPGEWTLGTSLAYQWMRNGKPIAKATTKTYTSSKADLNQVLQVRVTGTKPNYTTMAKVSASKRPVTGKFVAFTPKVNGSARVGSKLTATMSSTGASSPALKYQWLRNGKPIKGATARSYLPVAADLKQKISVKITASKSGYTTMVRTSASKTVGKGILKEGIVKTTGTFKVGSKITAVPTGWSAGNTYHYKWLRDGKVIKGATSKTYKLQKADRRKSSEIEMTVKRPGYTSIVVYSGTRGVR